MNDNFSARKKGGLDPVRVRFAPSPTGTLHTGGGRTVLFNYLLAKQTDGKFILRIDDTDKERSTKEFEAAILSGLEWLGLSYDELYYQSKRGDLYKQSLEKLLTEDKIYWSKEEPAEEGRRSEVLRFRNPNRKIKFTDMIKGDIEFDTTELGDFVIAKDLDTPLYHLASVVDDADLKITHIIRGEDHISNTPRQILMWEALGAPVPVLAHLPMILAPDRSKLSKRKHAEIASFNTFIEQGYLPEAMVNFLALTGWNPGTEQEVFTLAELIKAFDMAKVQKSPAIFDLEKLKWFNREHLKKLSDWDFWEKARRFLPTSWQDGKDKLLEKIIPQIRERVSTLGEVGEMEKAGELEYYFTAPVVTKELLKTSEFLPMTIELVERVSGMDFTAEKIKETLWDFATEKGRGNVLWPMRTALTGREKSPDPFTVAAIIGKEETIRRLNNAKNL